MSQSEYKPINLTYYNPCTAFFKAGKSDRETVTLYTCCNTDNCDAYKRKKCVMLNGLDDHSCPYGKKSREVGYTKAARRCGELIKRYRKEYGEVEYNVKNLKFVCFIGDYVFLNLPFLINYTNSIRSKDFFICGDMIKKSDFTPEFVVELIKYRPLNIFYGVIDKYQKESVPLFCAQLKRYMPDMYERVKAIYPEIDSQIKDIDYRGKKAKVKTLLPGKVKLSIYLFDWDGKAICAKAGRAGFTRLKDEELVIYPNDDTCVEIVDNATVTEETEFADE